jgi:hypothetical protein
MINNKRLFFDKMGKEVRQLVLSISLAKVVGIRERLPYNYSYPLSASNSVGRG